MKYSARILLAILILSFAVPVGQSEGQGLLDKHYFTSSGTFTPHANATLLIFECVGGGAGGGGAARSALSNGAAGGGGAGGWAEAKVTSIAASYTVTIGAGGAGGTAGNNNGAGGGDTTVVGTGLSLTCGGGNGGTGASAGAGAVNGGNGGTSSGGNLHSRGTGGGVGMTSGSFHVSGMGGPSIYGDGGRSRIGDTAGQDADGYGAGGSGGAASSANQAGGAGADGLVVVWEYVATAGPQGPQGETGATGPQGETGAQGIDGEDGFNALTRTTVEAPGGNCVAGGFLVESGTDDGGGGFFAVAGATVWGKQSGQYFITDESATVATFFGIDWSPSSQYLATTTSSPAGVRIYSFDGEELAEVTTATPGGFTTDVKWSPDGDFLAVGHSSSPFLSVYEFDGATLTKISNPATLPGAQVNGVAWSDDKVAAALNSGDGLAVYSFDGSTLTKISHGTNPGGTIRHDVDWSPDGAWLALASDSGRLHVYKDGGSSLTHWHFGDAPSSNPILDVEWSPTVFPDGYHLVTGHTNSPGIYAWAFDLFVGGTLDGPYAVDAALPGAGSGIAISPRGDMVLAVDADEDHVIYNLEYGDTVVGDLLKPSLTFRETLAAPGGTLEGDAAAWSGHDAADGVLQDHEVDSTSYVCHGEDGADGVNGTAGATGPQGPQGEMGISGLGSGNLTVRLLHPLVRLGVDEFVVYAYAENAGVPESNATVNITISTVAANAWFTSIQADMVSLGAGLYSYTWNPTALGDYNLYVLANTTSESTWSADVAKLSEFEGENMEMTTAIDPYIPFLFWGGIMVLAFRRGWLIVALWSLLVVPSPLYVDWPIGTAAAWMGLILAFCLQAIADGAYGKALMAKWQAHRAEQRGDRWVGS